MCSDLVAVHRSVVPDLPFSLYQDPSLPPSPSNPNLNSNSNSNSKGADPSPSLALSAGSSGRGWADAAPVPVPVPPASSALRVLRYCMETAATVAGALTPLLRDDDLGPVSFEPSQQQQQQQSDGTQPQPQPIEKESGAASSRIQWGFLAPMAVLKLSSKTKTGRTAPARGSLILRLLPATRGQVGS